MSVTSRPTHVPHPLVSLSVAVLGSGSAPSLSSIAEGDSNTIDRVKKNPNYIEGTVFERLHSKNTHITLEVKPVIFEEYNINIWHFKLDKRDINHFVPIKKRLKLWLYEKILHF